MNLSTYQNLIEKVGVSKLDEANKDAYNIVKEGSNNFTDPSLWSEMLADADIKDAYEAHVKALQKIADGSPAPVKKESPAQKSKRKAKTKETMQVIELAKDDKSLNPEVKTKPVKAKKKSAPKKVVAKSKAKPKKTVKKKAVKKVVTKAVKKAMKKEAPKFPVTVKRLSKELQLIKRMASWDGKRKPVNALLLLKRDLEKTLKSNPDRKPVLNDMHNRLKGAIAKAEKAGVKELDIALDKAFKSRLIQNTSNPRPKMKVEYLAGVDTGKK